MNIEGGEEKRGGGGGGDVKEGGWVGEKEEQGPKLHCKATTN